MTTYIYSRVSTEKQQTDGQLHELLKQYPSAHQVEETISGTATHKPVLNALLGRLTAGDVLVVAALDRLGRNAGQAIQLIDSLYGRGVTVVSIREGLDYSKPAGKFQGQIMLAMSELERNLISERTKAALAALKAKGVRLGAKPKFSSEQLQAVKEYRAQGMTIRAIAAATGISVSRVGQLVKGVCAA